MPIKQQITVGTLVTVRFPALNKNDTLQRNDEEIERRYYRENCVVEKVVKLTAREWNAVTQNFMADNDLWKRIGGRTLLGEDRADFAALCIEHGADAEDPVTWYRNPLLMEFFQGHCFTQVVAVQAPGRPTIYVNTEGYAYARYVGRI
jgi:hypothetical protein